MIQKMSSFFFRELITVLLLFVILICAETQGSSL